MAYQVIDCPATFDFELSDGSVHSMPVPMGLGVDEAVQLSADLDAAKGNQIKATKVYERLILRHCPELEGVGLSGFVITQIARAWLKASPTSGESSASRD